MSFITRVFGLFGGNATEQRKGSQDLAPASSAHDDTQNVGIDSALQVSAVWACIDVLLDLLCSLPVQVYKTNSDGDKEIDCNCLLHDVLAVNPNSRQTLQEFWEQMDLNFFLRGNSYAKLDRNKSGEVIAMWPLPADQVEVILDEDGSIIYVYTQGTKGIVYTSENILHIKGKGNGIVGLSPLDYMRSSVSLSILAQNHTVKTYKKDARRPTVLMTEQILTDKHRKAVKKNLAGIVSGKDDELHILEANFKVESIGMSPSDIQLLETRKFSIKDIARWFGVNSVLINDSDESSSLGSSLQEIINFFYKIKLRSNITRKEQAIHKRVLTAKQRAQGFSVSFDTYAILRLSLKDRIDFYAKAVQNGLKTRNECRKLENDSAVDGGEKLTAQVNLIPLDQLGQQKTEGGTVPPETIQQ